MNLKRNIALQITILLLTLVLAHLGQAQDRGFSNECATPHWTRDRSYDVQHLRLNLSFEHSEGTVSGTATTVLTPLNDNLQQITFDAVDLSIQSVTRTTNVVVEDISQHGNIPLTYVLKNGQLIIDLDRPYQSGEPIIVAVTYKAQPRLGLYFIRPDDAYPDKPVQIWSQGEMEENRHWLPCYDFPNDMMTSEIIVTIPEGQIAISNGELIETQSNPDEMTVTYYWKENVPHVSYLVSLVVGNFIEVRDEWNGIPISYYVDPKDADKVDRSFRKTPDMMAFFSEMIGVKYPYEKYAQTTIADFMWGGMENISATTLTENTLHDERAHLDYSSDGLVAHELAHQWWGDLLTTKNWNHIWLNEGFATYFEALYTQHDKGPREFIMEMAENRKEYLKEDAEYYRRPIVTNRYEDPEQLFDRHSYQKGALVLHMIRNLLGDDLWWKAIRHYAREYAGHTVETNDFKQAIEDATGRSMDWFFEQWIYHGGHPEYTASWDWDRKRQAVELEVQQVQQVDEVTPLFSMPVEVAVTGEYGTRVLTVQVNQAEETFYLSVPQKPRRVEFDPEDKVLKELNFTKSKQEFLDQLSHGGDASRMRAAEWLAEYHDGKASKALGIALRDDPFRGVRAGAAWSLGEIRTKAARDSLIANLHDRHPHVRSAIVKALGNYVADEKVAAALEAVFHTDSSYYVRAAAVQNIARLGTPNAYGVCLEALEMDSHHDVIRKEGLWGLGKLGDLRGVDLALKWTTYGMPLQARSSAVAALVQLAPMVPQRKDEIRDQLITLLEDPQFDVRLAAMTALGKLGDTRAIPALEASLERELHFKHLDKARKALKKLGQDQGK